MKTQRVAFQGEKGAYSELATSQYFRNAEILPMKTLEEVFENTEIGKVEFAVIPIENSIEGSINETYDLLLQTNILVTGEIYRKITHCLITNKDSSSQLKS